MGEDCSGWGIRFTVINGGGQRSCFERVRANPSHDLRLIYSTNILKEAIVNPLLRGRFAFSCSV